MIENLNSENTYAVCKTDKPEVIAFLNLYESGDIWVKTKGCEDCSKENRLYCCGNCAMRVLDTGECRLHYGQQKPYHCVVGPIPTVCHAWCALEYKCIQGENIGKTRKVKDKGDIFGPANS